MAKNFDDYRNIWVFVEQRDGKLMNVALELLGEATKLAKDIDDETKVCALLVGEGVDNLAKECYEYGADVVYYIEDALLKNYTTDAYTKVIVDAVNELKPSIFMYGATHIGRDLLEFILKKILLKIIKKL